MLPFKTLERLANRPAWYPRYSRELIRWLTTIRLVGYMAFMLVGGALIWVQGRPVVELAIFSTLLFVGAPFSTYRTLKGLYPLETFSKGFVFDGIFLGYLVVVAGHWDVLVLLFLK